ncbi:MAG: PTS system mannose/fructose/N-acetylgalactosamine-transporter subunit IIB [Traorella sp.]
MQKIICFRIDDRLIHGQVAAMWTKHLKQNRIVVVDDEANQSDLQKQMLRLACPPGNKLSVLSVEKAINNFADKKYDGDTILMIVKSPTTIARLLDNGFKPYMPNEIVVGNMSGSKVKRQVAKGFNVDDNDVEAFNKICQYDIACSYQLLPADKKEDVKELLK